MRICALALALTSSLTGALLTGALLTGALLAPSVVAADSDARGAERDPAPAYTVLASATEAEAEEPSRPLEPRYQPREPEPKGWFDSSHLFGMTRAVSDTTLHPAGKLPLFILTVPLDLVLLPFAAVGGLF